MFKAIYLDDRNYEGDQPVGYFDSEELLVEALKKYADRCAYAGIEMYAGRKCYVVTNKPKSKVIFKNRYYLVKLENGWI